MRNNWEQDWTCDRHLGGTSDAICQCSGDPRPGFNSKDNGNNNNNNNNNNGGSNSNEGPVCTKDGSMPRYGACTQAPEGCGIAHQWAKTGCAAQCDPEFKAFLLKEYCADAKPDPSGGTQCDESRWPDKKGGLICSDCKVLVSR